MSACLSHSAVWPNLSLLCFDHPQDDLGTIILRMVDAELKDLSLEEKIAILRLRIPATDDLAEFLRSDDAAEFMEEADLAKLLVHAPDADDDSVASIITHVKRLAAETKPVAKAVAAGKKVAGSASEAAKKGQGVPCEGRRQQRHDRGRLQVTAASWVPHDDRPLGPDVAYAGLWRQVVGQGHDAIWL